MGRRVIARALVHHVVAADVVERQHAHVPADGPRRRQQRAHVFTEHSVRVWGPQRELERVERGYAALLGLGHGLEVCILLLFRAGITRVQQHSAE
eukprot:1008457-Rhodomonas_salina.3